MNTADPKKHFDVIVIGVGSMGAAACFHIAERGYTVLGLEQFSIPHEWGSHGGQSRIIRKAYYEHPDYIPLLQQAYRNWERLEQLSGQQIFHRTGLFYAAPAHHELLREVKNAATLYHIALEEWDRQTAQQRFPQFHLPKGYDALFEPDAGFVTPEKAIQTYTALAEQRGAIIHPGEKVLRWEQKGDSIAVTTPKQTYYGQKIILAGGAWSAQLIPNISSLLKVTRQVIVWLTPQEIASFTPDRFPCWLIAEEDTPGAYYGFPQLPENGFSPPYGIKIAHHFPALETDPDAVDRTLHLSDTDPVNAFVQKFIPAGAGPIAAAKICLYSNSPDAHFILDHLPDTARRVCMAWGFSGHGFKFASAIGEILADLAIEGVTQSPIDFLRFNRLIP